MMARERDRLSTLIERLLAFSRIEAGRYHYDFRIEDPTTMLQRALDRFDLELSTAGRPPLPVEVTSVQSLSPVAVDREALEEVLLNLLHNADKYTPGPDRRVHITLTQRRRKLWIDIEDNGLGVVPRDRRRIFKKFERGSDPQTSQVAGSGIGLTLALSILRAHGGDLRYAPARAQGSRFTVILPLPRSVKKTPGAPDDQR